MDVHHMSSVGKARKRESRAQLRQGHTQNTSYRYVWTGHWDKVNVGHVNRRITPH